MASSRSSCSIACWTRLSIDSVQRLAARGRIGQMLVDRALHPATPCAVDVGVADDMGGKAGLGIEPVGLALDREARFADRVDRLDQRRRGAAAQIDKRAYPTSACAKYGSSLMLGHQFGQAPRERQACRRLPGSDEWPMVHASIVRARGSPSRSTMSPRSGMRASNPPCGRHGRRMPRGRGSCSDDNRDDPGIDQHAEHQPLVHDRQHLAPLPDEAEPLGPWRDESGRRCVHRSVPESWRSPRMAWPEAAPAGRPSARRTGFVTGVARQGASSTAFLAGSGDRLVRPALAAGWAAASADFSTTAWWRGLPACRGCPWIGGCRRAIGDLSAPGPRLVCRSGWRLVEACARRPRLASAGSRSRADERAPCGRGAGRRGEHHRRLEIDLVLGPAEPRELEAAIEELVRRRAPTAPAPRRSSARAAPAGRACRSRSAASGCRAGRARSWSRHPRARRARKRRAARRGSSRAPRRRSWRP